MSIHRLSSCIMYCSLCTTNKFYLSIYIIFRMHSVIVAMESILFGLFVVAIFCDQITAIFSDETAVEQVISNSILSSINWVI